VREKALITGALPRPFVGPWVELGEKSGWEFEGLRAGVKIETVLGKSRAVIELDEEKGERVSVIAVEVGDVN